MIKFDLSEPVKISLKNSEESLREALAFASKTENPHINLSIAQIIFAVNQILTFSESSNVQVRKF